jgi:ubiquinone/menaquinone biosynthesis C-methylase UbiE
MTTTENEYLLGSKDDELDRLDLQAGNYRMATIDAMRWAGIEPGMKVLDIGSGTGAVAFEAARLVGPTGSVLGLDIAEVPVRTANERAVRLGLDNVSFQQADLATWQPEETFDVFDVLTGRLITMYLPDPSTVIASLSRALRPGGIVLLQEFAISSAQQIDGAALFQRALDRVLAAFRAVGVPTDLGYGLGHVFRGAGLGTPTMTVAARWEDGPDAVAYGLLAAVTRTLLPVMTAHHIAAADEVDIDTLEDRLREAGHEGSGVQAPLLVSAWARTPA